MAEGTGYRVVVAHTAQTRYQDEVLSYLVEHFSMERVTQIHQAIIDTVSSLQHMPNRGAVEEGLSHPRHTFRYILYRETRNLAIRIIYHVDENAGTVYITDFFPTRMNPERIRERS